MVRGTNFQTEIVVHPIYRISSEADDKGSKPISHIFYGQNIKTRLRHISKI